MNFKAKMRDGTIHEMDGEMIDLKPGGLTLLVCELPEGESTFFPLHHWAVHELGTGQRVCSRRSLLETKDELIQRAVKEMESVIEDAGGIEKFLEGYAKMEGLNDAVQNRMGTTND